MNNLQLYINDELVDLSDDHPIALTFQINNLAEVQNQQGNTSNQFKLPLTQRNRRILGYPDDVAFCTGAPYTQYPARLLQDGLEIIPYGIAELNTIEKDTAAITVLSGNVDFFDAIDGKLYDMGDTTSQWSNYGKNLVWKDYDHLWNVQNVATSQQKTEGWIWPVVDYGAFSDDFSAKIDVRSQRPGFFVHTAVELLAKSAGYKIDPDCFLLRQDMYRQLIVQFAGDSFDHGTDVQNKPNNNGIYAYNSVDFVQHYGGQQHVGDDFIFDSYASGSAQFNGKLFKALQPGNYNVAVSIPKLRLYGWQNGDHSTFLRISIWHEGPSLSEKLTETTLDFSQGFNKLANSVFGSKYGYADFSKTSMSVDVQMDLNDTIRVHYQFFSDFQYPYFIMNKGANLTVKFLPTQVLYGQQVQCERIFPDISQKDLLKDILQRFGIVCQTNNATRTISFNSFADIVNNMPVARDWSRKCLDQGKTVSFQLGNYAQVNYMRCKQDDAVLPFQFADDHIDIKDTTLPATADLFTSQFAPTLNRPWYGGTVAQILKIDANGTTNDMSIGTQPRLLVNQQLNLTNGQSVTFTDGNTANDATVYTVSVPYFYKPDGQYNLCFNNQPGNGAKTLPGVRTSFYAQLQKILTQTKKVVHYFMLTPRDILELDLLIPVYLQQDNAYYYINKIDAWRKGQPTKVELVKLG